MNTPSRAPMQAAVRTAPVPVSLPSRAPSRLLQRRCACGGSSGMQGECEECRKKKLLQRRAIPGAGTVAIPSIVHEVLGGGGRPLDPATRGSMEAGFRRDLSAVRIHDDARAGASARAVGADAYTVGQDIVFAPGRYAPATGAGRELLAHELAHTIQQSGFQRHADAGAIGLAAPAEDARLEAEADRAAARVVAGLPAGSGLNGSDGLRLSRQEESPGRDWTVTDDNRTVRRDRTIEISGSAGAAKRINQLDREYTVDRIQTGPDPTRTGRPTSVAFRVTPFYLPRSKGDVIDQYNAVLGAGALRAVYRVSGNRANVTLSEQGAPTSASSSNPNRPGNPNLNLRELWLMQNGWPTACANSLWQAAGGAPTFPMITGLPDACQVDHIVESQLGGANVPSNVQMLDRQPNGESGVAIRRQLGELAKAIVKEFDADFAPNWPPNEVTLDFTSIQRVGSGTVNPCSAAPTTGVATACWQANCRARSVTPTPALCAAAVATSGNSAAVPGLPARQPYPLTAGGQSATLQIAPRVAPHLSVALGAVQPGQTAALPVDPGAAENRAAAELIPGLVLETLHRSPAGQPKRDRIDATVDLRPFVRTIDGRIPAVLPTPLRRAPGNLQLEVLEPEQTGQLRLLNRGNRRLAFVYPYLSEASLEMNYVPGRGLTGEGTLTPSLPLLRSAPFRIEFGEGRFRAFYGQNNASRLRSPIPGLRFTEATLGIELAPAFRPSGVLAFEIGPARRPIATGRLEASADANGLVFLGTLDAHIPGTDQARGEVSYRSGQWSGSIVINSSQIRIPGVQRGEIRVDFTERGIVPSGTVDLLVAGQPVTLTVSHRNGAVQFAGRGRFTVPGLDPVEANVESDGTNISFSARTGFTVRSLRGTGTIQYRNGRWSGDGTINVNRGRAQGTLRVQFSEAGRIHGDGRLTYRITDNLTASLGVLLREDQSVRVSGDITLATIQLFPRLPRDGGRQRLLRFPRISIPIAGISLGPLGDAGLVARIDSEIGVYYGIGPGELRNTRLTTQFDPLAENPNFEFTAGTELFVPMRAGFYLQVDGSVALSAVVASISGGLTVTGEAGLEGSFTANAQLRYAQQRFEIQARAALLAQPRFVLGIDARVRAEAGVGPFSTSAEKVWNLARFSWGSNLQFGLAVPFRYASDQPFQMPSFNDIEWIYPRHIDFEDVVRSLIGRAGR
ncbi:MAG: DUF4157 domain-containing protein [Verrucomicrobiota bacterium]|jgi:hypothetical protein